ncbi:hypothetical protein HR09_06430 [Porphyromonas gulae]|uniref:hypothetical protein n=1 Tax=Porphyromonas gulae TaxID=111105 RepID=UPI00052B8119|nr:hypothetical protein [Porphyromonas gulae]KGN68632.1 hypothetical protein HR09_06430 [Porphyromonas gulae]
MKKFFIGILLATLFSAANAADVLRIMTLFDGQGGVMAIVTCTDGRTCTFNLKIQGDYEDYNNVMSQVTVVAKSFCASNLPCIQVSTAQALTKFQGSSDVEALVFKTPLPEKTK